MARRKKKDNGATRTVVVIVQDKSGSMYSRQSSTISGFNEYIESLQRDNEGAEVKVTLTQFDNRAHEVYTARPLAEVPKLNSSTYSPGGSTALYDAIGRSVNDTALAIGKNDRVLVVIMTDGQENSSHEYNHGTITSLMDDKKEAGWEFIFLGAGKESWATGASLGFDPGHQIMMNDSAVHNRKSYQAMAFATNSVLRGATADAYLATSPIKLQMEQESGFCVPDDLTPKSKTGKVKAKS